jgi:mono/diheme cytochrome c family protein
MKKMPVLFLGSFALAGGFGLRAQAPARPRYVPVRPKAHPKKPAKKAAATAAAKAATNHPSFERDVLPTVKKYCLSCHAGEDAEAGVDLGKFKSAAQVLKDGALWEDVARNVGASHMPPAKALQPTQRERDRMVAWIESSLSQAFCDIGDPGRVTLRRLNREEYNNSVRDIFGVSIKPADDFPSDDVGYGFDNIGDVLSISPLLMEKYLTAGEKVAAAAIVAPDGDVRLASFDNRRFEPKRDGGESDGGGRRLHSVAEVGVDHLFPAEGEYILRVRAWGEQAGDSPPKMPLKLNGKPLQTFEVPVGEDKPGVYEHRLTVPKGRHRVSAGFTNDFYDETLPQGKRDRNLIIEAVEIEGPRFKSVTPTPQHLKILPKPVESSWTPAQKSAYARERLKILARRVFRRAPSAAEVDRLAKYVELAQKNGDSFERGMQVAIQAMLASPHFLFRVELDPADPKATRQLSGFEIASRLSYFLWASAPDESLLWWAEQGKLSDPKHLQHQVRRMLKDPRASSLASSFAMQWLELRRLNDITPDPETFPNYTPELKADMQKETALFCGEIIRADRPITDFLNAKFSYLNGRMARHYGVPNVSGDKWQRVAFAGEQAKQRGGLLTHASILTVTSNPARTSPVKRGKWVLEQILGTPPPPAPPDVPALDEGKKALSAASLRQRMEQHRKDPNCASCHARMDPIGFGLENYDAIGAWRLKDAGFRIDASGQLTSGQKFNGSAQLRGILVDKKDAFTRALAEKMLTYATGRGVERSDKCYVDDIAGTVSKNGYKFSSLVTAVVLSPTFRTKRGDVKSVKK